MIGYAALARGRDDFTPLRGISYIVGVVVLWVALETPIDTLSDHYLQSVHMLQHVLLGILAPPLLLLLRLPLLWLRSRPLPRTEVRIFLVWRFCRRRQRSFFDL